MLVIPQVDLATIPTIRGSLDASIAKRTGDGNSAIKSGHQNNTLITGGL